jgi:hypothetical protein
MTPVAADIVGTAIGFLFVAAIILLGWCKPSVGHRDSTRRLSALFGGDAYPAGYPVAAWALSAEFSAVKVGLLGGREHRAARDGYQVPAASDVLDSIERRNWDRLRRLLRPEVHWTTAVEEHLHGPDAVIACLEGDSRPAPPAYHEQRDGRMVHWIDTPG